MAQWDLLPSMVPYLDPHLLVPVFEFLYTRKIYQKKVVQKCHMEMARVTKLVCVYEDFHTKFFPNEILPEEIEEALFRWIRQANAMKLAINGNILKEKAILLALKMGQDNFEASNG
ncbi:EIF3E [Cordylochernes scorpioides]|uniref:EIF3E n=1 Tax=Cordylochernes scorpioides TaxID=51811 RepID=A0ABY6LNI0_9ARAC|nr:EIF3E [Cordylochernes scorpioides]